MMPNNENNHLRICSKCENETNNYQYFPKCDHFICNNCFEKHLLDNNFILIFPGKVIECIITDCNKSKLYLRNRLNIFIKEESNNQNLINKYRSQFLINEYFILPFFYYEYQNYLDLVGFLFDFINDYFCCRNCISCIRKCENFCIFEVLESILAVLLFIFYIIAFPIFPHFAIKKLYYLKFIKEIKNKHNNKILLILITLGEGILFLTLIFPLMIIHYLYTILFFPILGLVCLIRNKIYDI